MKDDVKAGVKSTATLLQGRGIKPLLFVFGSTIVACLTLCGVLNRAGPLYFGVSVAGSAYLFGKELWQVDLTVPSSCLHTVRPTSVYANRKAAYRNIILKQFNQNGFVTGAVVWLGIFLDYLRPSYVA